MELFTGVGIHLWEMGVRVGCLEGCDEVVCCSDDEATVCGDWHFHVVWVPDKCLCDPFGVRCLDPHSVASVVVHGGTNVVSFGCMDCP